MINIEQFKDFQVAFEALRLQTVDVAIIEIREEEGDGEIYANCYVILKNKDVLQELPGDYHRINNFDGFRTFRVFKDAETVKTELNQPR